MYRVFKPKGSLSNITITNENTTSSVVVGRYTQAVHKILDTAGVAIPDSRDEWSFDVNEETGKALAMSCFTGHRPVRAKVKSEQKEPEKKKLTAYNYLFGYIDELDDDEDED